MIRFAKLFRAGSYPDKTLGGQPVVVDAAGLDEIIVKTQTAGDFPLWPAHKGGVVELGTFDAGSLQRRQYADGEWIVGQVSLPDEIDRRRLCSGLSIRLTADGRISETSLTPDPRVPGAAMFGSDQGDDTVFDGGQIIMPNEPVELLGDGLAPVGEGSGGGVLFQLGRLFGRQERVVTPTEEAATFTAEDVQRIVSEQVAEAVNEVKAEFTTELEILKAGSQSALFERVQADQSAYVARGCKPAVAAALVPLAHGLAEVTFTGEEAPVNVAEAARRALEASCGAVSFSRQLPSHDGQEEATFESAVAARAKALLDANPDLTNSEALKRAALEVS